MTNRCLRRVYQPTSGDSPDLRSRYSAESEALCASVMQEYVQNFTADRQYVGAANPAPQKCNGLAANGDVCTWGCQNAFTPVRNQMGCCYSATKSYYKELGNAGVDGAFSNGDLVTSECNRPPDPTCTKRDRWWSNGLNQRDPEKSGYELGQALHLFDIPISYFSHHVRVDFKRYPNNAYEGKVRAAMVEDIRRAAGLPADAVVIDRIEWHTWARSKVVWSILAQGRVQAVDIASRYNAKKASGQIVNLITDRLYRESGFASLSD